MKNLNTKAPFAKIKKIAGAVLAGGRCSRMGGRDKAFVKIENRAIIHNTLDTFLEVFEEVVLVTNSPEKYNDYSGKIIIASDIIKGAGALGGIYTGLCSTTREAVFFAACDMPFVDRNYIVKATEFYECIAPDMLIPLIGGSVEPFCAVYSAYLKKRLHGIITGGNDRSIRNFISSADVCYWHLDDTSSNRKIFCNVNTIDDVGLIEGTF